MGLSLFSAGGQITSSRGIGTCKALSEAHTGESPLALRYPVPCRFVLQALLSLSSVHVSLLKPESTERAVSAPSGSRPSLYRQQLHCLQRSYLCAGGGSSSLGRAMTKIGTIRDWRCCLERLTGRSRAESMDPCSLGESPLQYSHRLLGAA